MKTTIALLALLLAGCNTVQSVREEGARTTHDLQFAPFDAAGCMARNIEAYWHGMHTSVRSGGPGKMELIVDIPPNIVFAIADVQPRKAGSRATVTLSPHWFQNKEKFVPALVKGC